MGVVARIAAAAAVTETEIQVAIERAKGYRYIGDVIVPLAAGLIVGEALTNLTLTMIKLIGGPS